MPSRLLTVGIVLFWLGTTSWMVTREVWPRINARYFQDDEPPGFNIELTDEVSIEGRSARIVPWIVLKNGRRIGFAKTEMRRRPDRTFELHSEAHFKEAPIFTVKKVTGTYRVTSAGDLLAIRATITLTEKALDPDWADVVIEGEVLDGRLKPRLLFHGIDPFKGLIEIDPIPVSQQGGFLNTMLPLNRIPGLRDEQHWRVPRLDPLVAAGGDGPAHLGATIRYLEANVHADAFPWRGTEEPCWRIDYAEAGKAVTARTWVRQRDGLVLQQEARHEGMELVLQREFAR